MNCLEEVPVTIIGGGVVGLAIARRFSEKLGPEKVFLLEKNQSLGAEQSGRNSEVLHSGLNQNGLKAKFCIRGNLLLREFCHEHKIPLLENGKLVVAMDSTEDQTLDRLLAEAIKKGVPQLRKISKQEIKRLEPNIHAYSAIFAETAGVLDTATYLQTLARINRSLGTQILTKSKVVAIDSRTGKLELTIATQSGIPEQYSFKTRILINSAGLYSDEVAKQVDPNNLYAIAPVKGEYVKFKNRGSLAVFRNVYPVPWQFQHEGRTYYDLGIHLTPLTDGIAVRVGPAVKPTKNKADYSLTPLDESKSLFYEKVHSFLPNLRESDLEPDYAGILAEEKNTHDFIIERDRAAPNCLHLIGIESPGLTSSLALAEEVWSRLKDTL